MKTFLVLAISVAVVVAATYVGAEDDFETFQGRGGRGGGRRGGGRGGGSHEGRGGSHERRTRPTRPPTTAPPPTTPTTPGSTTTTTTTTPAPTTPAPPMGGDAVAACTRANTPSTVSRIPVVLTTGTASAAVLDVPVSATDGNYRNCLDQRISVSCSLGAATPSPNIYMTCSAFALQAPDTTTAQACFDYFEVETATAPNQKICTTTVPGTLPERPITLATTTDGTAIANVFFRTDPTTNANGFSCTFQCRAG